MTLRIVTPFILALSLASPAIAQAPALRQSIDSAKTLIRGGRADEARALLQELAKHYPRNNDVDFLLGLLAIEAKGYRRAIRHFRAILVRQPDAMRVRLELARAFYLDKDYENAFRNFQFARAGNPEPGVIATIDRFLAAIRQEKNWSYNISLALAPDTNINNATSDKEAIIFGLPFELSDDARRHSGVGLAIEGGAEYAPRIGKRARLRLGVALQRREYDGNDFDDMTIAVHAGPRLVLRRWDLSVIGTGVQRRFGGRRLNEGFGARIEATLHSNARTAISLGLAAQQIRYPHDALRTGPAYSAWGGVVRALTAASSLNARLGVSRKEARAPDLASWSGSISVGYYRDLPGGFSVYAEPGYVHSRFDAPDPFFGVRRRDHLYELRLAVLHRRIVLSRFTPRIAFTIARRQSTIDLFDYGQRRVEVGVTSAF